MRVQRTLTIEAIARSWPVLAVLAAVSLIGIGLYDVASIAGRNAPSGASVPASRSIEDTYASLERLALGTQPDHAFSATTPERALPDVETMVARLAERLEGSPNDVAGWKMLGWSYAQMDRFNEAAAAYERGLKVEPGSAELKALLDEAKAKVGGPLAPSGGSAEALPDMSRPRNDQITNITHGSPAEITAMVGRLADRLRQSPQNVDGWIQLIRSHVTLGDKTAAAQAFREATAEFKDDARATRAIEDVAAELSLPGDRNP